MNLDFRPGPCWSRSCLKYNFDEEEKAWCVVSCTLSLMFTWFEKVWQTYGKEKQKELSFDWLFMVFHAFKAHKTDVYMLLEITNTNLALVLAGYTSKCRLLGVGIQ